MKTEDVPGKLMDLARREWCEAALAHGGSWNVEQALRAILAAVLTEARKLWFAELFGTPEEIRAREAEAAQRKPDDVTEICERARPGEHERQVREKVAAEILAVQAERDQKSSPPATPVGVARMLERRKGMLRAAEIARGEA